MNKNIFSEVNYEVIKKLYNDEYNYMIGTTKFLNLFKYMLNIILKIVETSEKI
jgi:hypothetical protein